MMLNEITKAAGSHKRRKRVGRGNGSGFGGDRRPWAQGLPVPLGRRRASAV